jgi:hypothetical protein
VRKSGGVGMKDPEMLIRIVAIYGAILSTVVAIRQFLNERIRVTVTVKRNRMVIGDPRHKNTVLTELTVTNNCHRPVTIN